MPGRSTTDHISTIRLLAEKAREFRKDRALFVVFVDLKAAFDSVDRDCLWHILHSVGIPPKMVRVLERLYTDTSSCVRINNTLSDWFTISSGVRQGCVADPDLFNCIIDYLTENVSAMVPGIQLGPYHVTDLEYADDAAIFATHQNQISLRQPLWRHSSISLETKLRVYQASVLSVLLYGSECWPIFTSLCSRLSEFDMRAQRTITNTKWFEYKTNIEVRTLTNRQPIQRYIAQGRLPWFGHILRSPLNHPALANCTFNPRAAGWSRSRGAPRTRWSDVLGKDLKQLGTTLTEASNIALALSGWSQPLLLVPSLRPRGKSLGE